MIVNKSRPYSWGPIICGMSWGRQRVVLATVGVLAPLLIGTACQARSSVEAAQTAIVAAQTALPGAQATAQAGATAVSGVLANGQPILIALQSVLQGANVQVQTTPDGAAPDAVTSVAIDGTDAQGTLAQLDPNVRRAAALAALRTAAQYYPQATITLTVKDTGGAALINGRVTPGQAPSVQ
jgi:hypothetical protein